MFVGGLSWETTHENLQSYFSRYGELIDCVVMKNSDTGRSRGFGFVTFADSANVSLVLQSSPHQLDGRTVDPKPCNPRTLQKENRKCSSNCHKVFLGGIPNNITETFLRTYFIRFGKVMEVFILYDQKKNQSRRFGFVSFEDEDAAERCVAEHFVCLNGKQVEVKKAVPFDKMVVNSGKYQCGPPQNGEHTVADQGICKRSLIGQMGAPLGGMPMGGNMIQVYEVSVPPPQTQGYLGFEAPPELYGQKIAPSYWGPNFCHSQQTDSVSYGLNQTEYKSNCNGKVLQNSAMHSLSAGALGTESNSYTNIMYPNGGDTADADPTPPSAPYEVANDHAEYRAYTHYLQDSGTFGGGRSYGGSQAGSAQDSGGVYPKQYLRLS